MNKAYKYRIYPTEEQKVLFAKTFGCCRKVWNLMLDDKIAYYRSEKKMLHNTPAQYKKDYPYLREVDSLALANVQLQLQAAYKNFFSDKKSGFPKRKKKHKSKDSYTTNNQNGTVAVFDRAVKIPKAGYVKAVIHRAAPSSWKLKSATISHTKDGKYYISVLYEYDAPVRPVEVDKDKVLGLDYKSDGLYVDSNGVCADMPHFYRKAQKQLAKAQRILSRRKGSKKNSHKSNNWIKQHLKVNKIYAHVANQRRDFLQKLSAEIANQYDLVSVEDISLKVISSKKGLGLGKATADNGYADFVNMLTYKLRDRGKWLIKVDRFYPSSQLCRCGYKNPVTKDLSIRTVTCPVCGRTYDRDVNAAINIKNEGYRIYRSA
jgi:putative transposase